MSTGGSQVAPALSAALLVLVTARFAMPRRSRGVGRLTAGASSSTSRVIETAVGAGPRDGVVTRRPSRPAVAAVCLGGALVVATGTVLGGRTMMSLLTVGVVGAAVLRQRVRHRRRRAEATLRAGVIEACAVLSADLRAGRPPRDALEGAAGVCAVLRPAAAAARLGGDAGAALTRAAGTPGAAGLRSLGAAWRVAERSGAAFATIVERLAESLRADESVRRQVAAGLAGTRATARLLAALPLFGIALGYGIGADPVGFLTATPVGRGCLLAGLALAVLGLEWVERLASRCERER